MAPNQTTDEKELLKIYQVLRTYDLSRENTLKYVEEHLDSDFDINYQLTLNSPICRKKPEYAGNTLLHFAAAFYRSYETSYYDRHKNISRECDPIINYFIKRGSDFTIKNSDGYTPLLLDCDRGIKYFQNSPKIASLLFAHLNHNNATNHYCKNGISHFHMACTTNHVEVVDFFLKAGVSIDERVNDDSPKYPGYTPLHLAAYCGVIETMKLLLSNGANMNSKDAKGSTPLHLLINKHQKLIFDKKLSSTISYSALLPDDVKLTYLHLSCISDDVQLVKNLIKKGANVNSPIKFDSPLWPGYTPLHVAFDHDKLPIAMLLLENGANLSAKDARGKSPFDLCIKKCSLDKIIEILSTVKRYQSFEIKFIDGTRLLDVLYAFEDSNKFENFLKKNIKNINIYITKESPICPGYNLLHLLVLFDKSLYVKELFISNMDFNMRNADGTSPLHLAFYLKKKGIIEAILNCYKKLSANFVDQENLTFLHIACAAHHHMAIKYFLRKGSDPNLTIQNNIEGDEDFIFNSDVIRAGSTPFHIAVKIPRHFNTDNFLENIATLLTHGANVNAVDVDGVTPLQIILEYFNDKDFSKPDIEEMLCQFFSDDSIEVQITKAISLIILRTSSFLLTTTSLFEKLCSKFLEEKHYEKLGLTKLHAACALGDLSVVKEELKSGADVNQCVALDSDIWPGDTALHILFQKKSWYKYEIAKLLLEHGADLTLKNARNLTPLHLSEKKDLEKGISLLRGKFTKVNPVSNEGLSHFHLCCMTNNVLVAEEFLKSGVDVNATADMHTDRYKKYDFEDCVGYTALHFAVLNSNQEIVNLLIKYGADLYSEDADGQTPFHLIASSKLFDENRVESLIRCPSINFAAVNRFGEAVFEGVIENCMKSKNELYDKRKLVNRIINLVLNKGINIDFSRFTTERLDGSKLIVSTACYCSKQTFQRLINSIPDLTNVDDKGQNASQLILTTESKDPAKNCQTLSSCGDCEVLNSMSIERDYRENSKLLAETTGQVNLVNNERSFFY